MKKQLKEKKKMLFGGVKIEKEAIEAEENSLNDSGSKLHIPH